MPELPLPYADTYTEPPVVDRIGNTGAGVALGCRALGLRVTLVDLIGDDPQGALIRDHLTPPGVDFRHAVTAAGTRRSVLLVGPDGRRTSLFIPGRCPGSGCPGGTSTCPHSVWPTPTAPATRSSRASCTAGPWGSAYDWAPWRGRTRARCRAPTRTRSAWTRCCAPEDALLRTLAGTKVNGDFVAELTDRRLEPADLPTAQRRTLAPSGGSAAGHPAA